MAHESETVTIPVIIDERVIGHAVIGQDGNVLCRIDERQFTDEIKELAIINLIDGITIKPNYIPAVEASLGSKKDEGATS